MPISSFPIADFRLPIADLKRPSSFGSQSKIGNWQSTMSDRFPVIDRLLAVLQRHVRFLPGRLAAFMPSPPGHLAEVVGRVHSINLDLKDRLDRVLNLRLGSA